MLNLMVCSDLQCFLYLFLHYILWIFQVVEIIGGWAKRYVWHPNIFIGGGGRLPPPPCLWSYNQVPKLNFIYKILTSIRTSNKKRSTIKLKLAVSGNSQGHHEIAWWIGAIRVIYELISEWENIMAARLARLWPCVRHASPVPSAASEGPFPWWINLDDR